MKKQPLLVETAPGEVRTTCWRCGKIVRPHQLYCSNRCQRYTENCERCGKACEGRLCVECSFPQKGKKEKKRKEGGKITQSDRPTVERMWAEGLKAREICEALGVEIVNAPALIGQKRAMGWDLPHRAPWAVETGRKRAAALNAKNAPAKKPRRGKRILVGAKR